MHATDTRDKKVKNLTLGKAFNRTKEISLFVSEFTIDPSVCPLICPLQALDLCV